METEKVWENKKNTVLIAEDDELSYLVLKKLLSKGSYKILHARDGREAVELFQLNHDVGLILMDIQMPVMDGFSATREIRKLDNHVPVIVQTGSSGDWVREKAFSSGCSDFIMKPVGRDVLGSKVGKYLHP